MTADGAAPKVDFPAEYDLTQIDDAIEHYSPALLLAVNEDNDDLEDVLEFYHAGGLVRFELQDVATTTTKIEVIFDKDVTGEFDVITDDDDEPIPYVQTRDGSNNTVTFTLTSAEIGADGTLELNIPVPCGTYEGVQVKIYSGDELKQTLEHASPLEFARHHGKRVAFVETTVEFIMTGQPGSSSTDLGQIEVPSGTPTVGNDGGIITLSPNFVSYKTDGENVEKVPFKLQYSPDGKNSTWTDDVPEWISFASTVDPTGSVPDYPQELSVIIDQLKNLIPMTPKGVPMPAGSRTENLQNTPAVSGIVDLSTINVATGATVATTTANCYVVQAPGTYTFPFVYGNGVKDGVINEPAFRGMKKNADTEEYEYRADAAEAYVNGSTSYPYAKILGRFLDHRDQPITSPYISEQLGGGTYTAKILWMDQPELIESVSFVAGTTAEQDHIEFTVTQEGIAQGNAVIGVLDASGTIVWSWHIWVTDEELDKTKDLRDTKMSPVNVGFCNLVQIGQYRRLTAYLRIVQDDPSAGKKTSNSVKITVGNNSNYYLDGNNPHFIPGRKDPIPGSDGGRVGSQNSLTQSHDKYVGDKRTYTIDDAYKPQYAIQDQVTLGGAIQHPYIQYVSTNTDGVSRWMTITYGNLWNSTQTIFNMGSDSPAEFFTDDVTKTIYDPSPVGYKVPGPGVFRVIGFDDLKSTAYTASPDGIRFYTVNDANGAIFGAQGQRTRYLRYQNSALLYYCMSDMRFNSSRFLGNMMYLHGSHQTYNISTVDYPISLLPTVDR